MATLMSALLAQTRENLVESTAAYWTDAALLVHANNGIKDLWRRINDLYQEYFVTVDDTNVTLTANGASLTGVPADVFRIVAIEPRIVGASSVNPGLIFQPRKYNHRDFQQARAQTVREPNNTVVFYDVMNAGAPVGAPTILVAPRVTSAVNLRLTYNQTLPTKVAGDSNPIPGESDNALVAWMTAYARAKEREDRAPDPEWLAIYGTEKTNLVQQLTPRSIQEPEMVEGFFEDLWTD